MKDVKIMRALVFWVIILSFVVGAFACKKQEGKIEKIQTVIDKPLPSDAFKADILIENPPTATKANSIFYMKVKVKNKQFIMAC